MVRERRVEGAGLSGVGATRLDADADHVALAGQKCRALLGESRRMGAIWPSVQKRITALPLAPPAAQQHPRARRDAAVLGLPSLHALHRQQEVGVLLSLGVDVPHAGGAERTFGR